MTNQDTNERLKAQAPTPPPPTEAEKPAKQEEEILKLAGLMRELVTQPAWIAYVQTLRAQVSDRQRLLQAPLHEASVKQGDGTLVQDFVAKAAVMETVKGAVIGLELAIRLPSSIIDHANSIRKERGEQ